MVAWSNYSVSVEQYIDALSIAAQSKRAVRFVRWYVKLIREIEKQIEREREAVLESVFERDNSDI